MMVTSDTSDAPGGRFAMLYSNEASAVTKDNSSKSGKRRRRKSAKGHNDDDQTGAASSSILLNGSSSASVPPGKPPLRSISEIAVLRSNSADASSRLESVTEQRIEIMRPEQQLAEEALQPASRRPHLSLSFQDSSRPANEGDGGSTTCFECHLWMLH